MSMPPPNVPSQVVDPSAIRFKMAVACDVCRRRKVKCDGERPCTTCTRTRKECTFSVPKYADRRPASIDASPPVEKAKRRKVDWSPTTAKRAPEASGSQIQIKAESSFNPHAQHSGRRHLLLIDSDDQLLYSGPSSWVPLFERLGLLKAVESTETGGTLVSFDSHSSDAYGIASSTSFSNDCLDRCLQICPLKTIYGVFAQYLGFPSRFPLFHIPSVLAELVAVTQKRLPCTPQYGAMLMSVLALAVRTVPQTINILPEEFRKDADKLYFNLAHTLLRESTNMLDIRYILALYHLALYSEGQKSAVGRFSSFVAEAIGLAYATGLHRITTDFEMDPVTSQIRTRLFWALYALDTALTYSHGRPPLLKLADTTTPLPEMVDDQLITKSSIVSKPDTASPVAMLGARTLLELYSKLERVLSIINGVRDTEGVPTVSDSARRILAEVNRQIDELETSLPSSLFYQARPPSFEASSFIWSSRVRSTILFVRTLIARHLLLEDGGDNKDPATLFDATRAVCQMSKDIVQLHSVLLHVDLIQQCTFDSVSHLTAAGHTLVACMFKDRSLSLDYRPVLLSAIDMLDLLQSRYPIAESAARILTDLGRRIGQSAGFDPGNDATMIRILARKHGRMHAPPTSESRSTNHNHVSHDVPITTTAYDQPLNFDPFGVPTPSGSFDVGYSSFPVNFDGTDASTIQPGWTESFSFVNDGLLDLFGQ